jgi:hypothetical protein
MKQFTESDCYLCEDIENIERRNDLNSELIAEKFVRNEIPLIIDSSLLKEEIEMWPIANKSFFLEDLEKVLRKMHFYATNK